MLVLHVLMEGNRASVANAKSMPVGSSLSNGRISTGGFSGAACFFAPRSRGTANGNSTASTKRCRSVVFMRVGE